MRRQILAGAMGLVLAAGLTTSADAFDRDSTSKSGLHGSRFTGVRSFSELRHGGWNGPRFVASRSRPVRGAYDGGHYRSLGPLGFTLDDGRTYGYGPGSSVAAWSW